MNHITTTPAARSTMNTTTHVYLLLDRSGSMASIQHEVIAGVNAFLTEQRGAGPNAKVTIVQFDSQNDQEVVVDHARIANVRPLTHHSFQPRGGTPLLDATGLLIRRADRRADRRMVQAKAPEDIVFVTVTDGQENQSSRFSRQDIKKLVTAREADGWTFVFLSSDLDAYADAEHLGYTTRGMQVFSTDGRGAELAFASMSDKLVNHRGRVAAGMAAPAAGFFEDDKVAEADRSERLGDI